MSGYDLLIQGVYFCDLIFTGLPCIPTLGTEVFGTGFDALAGGTFNTVLALHRLGIRVGWDCDFGSDLFSQYVLGLVRSEGIDDGLFRVHDHPVQRVSASMSFPHDRAFISFVDPQPEPQLAPIIRQNRPRGVLLPHLDLDDTHAELCRAAHEVGAFVYMDCQYNHSTLDEPAVEAAIRAVDIFSPNESEALRLTGTTTVEEALRRLAALVPMAIIKQGAKGARLQTGDRVIQMPGLTVDVFDTTGAGACFNAGFLYGYLRGEPLETCLRCGNICGALSTTARGVMNTPTQDQVQERLKAYPA
jgi:sugar/nucleoside kinase (ribokinase family)